MLARVRATDHCKDDHDENSQLLCDAIFVIMLSYSHQKENSIRKLGTIPTTTTTNKSPGGEFPPGFETERVSVKQSPVFLPSANTDVDDICKVKWS